MRILRLLVILTIFCSTANAAQITISNSTLTPDYDWDEARGDINSNFTELYTQHNFITVTGPVNLDELDTFVTANTLQISELVTLSGVPAHSTDLGVFTGTTIPDSSDTKEALQALETAVEAGGGGAVDSVNGYTGVVVLDQTDIEAATVVAQTTTGATLDVDYSASVYQTVTFDQNCAVSVINWPVTGTRGKIELRVVNGGAFTVTVAGKTLPLTAAGTDVVVLWTEDGGTTVYGGVAMADL